MFRFKRSIPVEYSRQGYIYFVSKRYKELTAAERRQLRELCRKAGGEYHQALLEYVTTENGAAAICTKYYLSISTLERLVRRYYIAFDRTV